MPILPSQSEHASAVYADMIARSSIIDAGGRIDFYPQAIRTELSIDPKDTGDAPDYLFIGSVAVAGLIVLDGSAPDISDVLASAQGHDEIDMASTLSEMEADCRTMVEFSSIDGCEPVVRSAKQDISRGLFEVLIVALAMQMSDERAQYSSLRTRIGY